MKKLAISSILVLMCCFSSFAQGWGYRGSIDLKYGFQTLEDRTNTKSYDSEFAVGLAFNIKQVQFHKNPVGGVMYFGLDTGIDLDFAKYRDIIDDDYQKGGSLAEALGSMQVLGDWNLMQVELGIPVGPYMKIAPMAKAGKPGFKIQAYYHFVPSLSGIIVDSEYCLKFAPFQAVGGVIGWKWLNVGYEYRIGAATYKMTVPQLSREDDINYKTSAHRVFVRFAFGK